MREVLIQTLGGILVIAGCLLQGGCQNSSSPAAEKIPIDVTEENVGKLTKENLAKIKSDMTHDDVKAILGQGLPPSVVKDDAVYEVGWVHKSSKKEILVKFRGNKVTGTSSSKFE